MSTLSLEVPSYEIIDHKCLYLQVHQMVDSLDESIDASGGAGTRIACCVITQVEDGASSVYASIVTLAAAVTFTLLSVWL